MSHNKKCFLNKTSATLSLILAILLSSGIYIYFYKYIPSKNATRNLEKTNSQNIVKDVSQEALVNSTPKNDDSPAISKAYQQEALAIYDQGLKLYYQRNYNSALALFNKALALDPNCYQALNAKGATYAFLGRYSEGISLVKQAIQIKPDFEYAYFNLGISNELAGNWNDAISAYQKAINLNSKDEWAFYGIASIYGRQGNIDLVVKYLQQAIAIDPGVKDSARDEKDFDPVRNDPKFKALINQEEAANTPIMKESSIPILYYHSILTEPGNELRMPPEQFAVQMKYLFEHGYHVITLEQLYNHFYGNENLPDKPIAINFDDGYVDNYTNAFPILQKYNFVATVFMVSSYVNGTGFLTADQLRTLQSSGWTIGGHTENHFDLSKTNAGEITNELKNSRKTLEGIIGQPLKYFAYPYGGYNSDVINKVKQDGYQMAVTTNKGWASAKQSPFLIKRVYCYANMGISEFIHRVTNPNY